jgi:hypothetical protein
MDKVKCQDMLYETLLLVPKHVHAHSELVSIKPVWNILHSCNCVIHMTDMNLNTSYYTRLFDLDFHPKKKYRFNELWCTVDYSIQ